MATVKLTGDEKDALRGLQAVIKQQKLMVRHFRKTAKEAKTAGKQVKRGFDTRPLKKFAALLGVAGIAGAIAKVSSGYNVWLGKIREVTAETKKASNEIVALAALQEGGTKAARVAATAGLAASYGIADRGMAFNAVQALQSARGSFGAGMKGAATVFAASQMGIPLEDALELELKGAALGAKPGQTLRRAYAAGQASARDPATMARAGEGLLEWKDQDLGMAAGAVLAAMYGREKVGTYLKAAGIGLSTTSAAGFQKTLAELGVGTGTRREKLEALKAAGLDTTEGLAEAGLSEMRQRQGVALLVSQYGEVKRIEAEILEQAKPGLFARQRRGVEKELPMLRADREIGVLTAAYRDELAFGPDSAAAQAEEAEQRRRGWAFARQGTRQRYGVSLVDEEGRSNEWDQFKGILMERVTEVARTVFNNSIIATTLGGGPLAEPEAPNIAEVLLEGLGKISREQVDMLEKIERNTAQPKGTAALVPATEDR